MLRNWREDFSQPYYRFPSGTPLPARRPFTPVFSLLPRLLSFFFLFLDAVFFFLAIVITPFSKQRTLPWGLEPLSDILKKLTDCQHRYQSHCGMP